MRRSIRISCLPNGTCEFADTVTMQMPVESQRSACYLFSQAPSLLERSVGLNTWLIDNDWRIYESVNLAIISSYNGLSIRLVMRTKCWLLFNWTLANMFEWNSNANTTFLQINELKMPPMPLNGGKFVCMFEGVAKSRQPLWKIAINLLIYWGRDKMSALKQTIISNSFS